MTHEDLMRQVFGLDNAAIIHVLEQLKPKTHGLYQIELVNERLIVKVYDHQHQSAAHKEIRCHNLFSQLPFVANLPYAFDKAGYTFLGYEWIDGQNLSDFLNSKHGQSPEVRKRVLLQVVDQIIQMLKVSHQQPIHTSSLKLSFSNLLLKGLLPAGEEEQFKHDNAVVKGALERMCEQYPGLFLDRNPANMVYDPQDQELFQIDFACVERTSPIFDLVQLPYHTFLLKKTFQQLIDMREPVEMLRQWVERFTHYELSI